MSRGEVSLHTDDGINRHTYGINVNSLIAYRKYYICVKC